MEFIYLYDSLENLEKSYASHGLENGLRELERHIRTAKPEPQSFAHFRQQVHSSLDKIKGTSFYCLNVKGNKFRAICEIDFQSGVVLLTWFGTHAEYNKPYT